VFIPSALVANNESYSFEQGVNNTMKLGFSQQEEDMVG
jgi:hypothetical protein